MRPDIANDEDRVKGNRARTKINLKPYLNRIRRVRDGEEFSGFTPVLAPGHTPGHTCWLLAAGSGGFMAFGDVVHLSAIQISHPETALTYDLDKNLAVKSRKRILDMAASERLAIAGARVNAPDSATWSARAPASPSSRPPDLERRAPRRPALRRPRPSWCGPRV